MQSFRGTGARGQRLRSRVQLPAAHDVPQNVLAALRATDPMLDAYIKPDGEVWILQYQPERERIATGRAELAEARGDSFQEPMYAAHLMAQGFWLLGSLPYVEGTSAGAAVALAQRVLYATEVQVRTTMRRRRGEADGTAHSAVRTAVIRDRIRSSARGDWAHAYRGRKTFGYGRSRAIG